MSNPVPETVRLPSPGEARIIRALEGESVIGGQVARLVGVTKHSVYTMLNGCIAKGYVMRVGNSYRSTVLGVAALKRYDQIETLKALPLELDEVGS